MKALALDRMSFSYLKYLGKWKAPMPLKQEINESYVFFFLIHLSLVHFTWNLKFKFNLNAS